ncbi:MAG: diacylglycerol kinase family lipid kinase, partial [Thermomicrobiaceae bacterium]|nr:diacylglycerol kinase family lipid kinase [Thermomicrobiaceae bacterium]
MEGPLHVIVNPAAGNGRTARLWPRVAARLRDRGLPEPCAHPTAGPGDATRIVRDLL